VTGVPVTLQLDADHGSVARERRYRTTPIRADRPGAAMNEQ
jgi:hypothetical protein